MAKRTVLYMFADSDTPLDPLVTSHKMGLSVVMVSSERRAWPHDLVDGNIETDIFDVSAAVSAAKEFARTRAVHGVVAFDDKSVPTAAAIASSLGLPGNPYEAAYAARNKYLMRTKFQAHGLPGPRFGLATEVEEAERLVERKIGYPAVIKPLFGTASQGVVRVDDPDQLRQAFERTLRIVATHRAFVKEDPLLNALLIEEYMEGTEVTVDGLIRNGDATVLAIFDKPEPLVGPFFEETIYTTPSRHPEQVQKEAIAMARGGIAALGLTSGPFHAELRLTPAGPRLLEIAARRIGGICSSMFAYSLGIDFNELIFKVALGDPYEIHRSTRRPSGVMMIPVPARGRLVQVEGIEMARNVEGVLDVILRVNPGDMILTFPEQSCYIGFILAVGENPEQVQDTLLLAHSKLKFVIEASAEASDEPRPCRSVCYA